MKIPILCWKNPEAITSVIVAVHPVARICFIAISSLFTATILLKLLEKGEINSWQLDRDYEL